MATPLVIYLFNEAASGTTPTSVLDSSTGTALSLTITYGTSSWATIGAGRGLNFGGTCGAISAALNGTKVATALAGITGVSCEAVVNTASYTGFNTIFGFQDAGGTNDIFVLLTGSSGVDQVGVAGAGGTAAWFDVTPGLHHLLAVQDTSQAVAADRLKLYVDGVRATVNSSPFAPSYPTLNQAIDAGFTNYANNRIAAGCLVSAGTESFVGPVYFGALYASALTSGDATAHSTALLANNDADPNGAVAAQVPFRRPPLPFVDDDQVPAPRRRLLIPPDPARVPYRRQVFQAWDSDQPFAAPRRALLVPSSPSGAVSGTTTATLTEAGTLAGVGALVGATSMSLAPASAAIGAGAVTGATTATLSPTGALVGVGGVSASALASLAPAAGLIGAGVLSGTTTATLAPSAMVGGSGASSGATSATLSSSATIAGAGTLTGATTAALNPAATMGGAGVLTGAATLSLAASANPTLPPAIPALVQYLFKEASSGTGPTAILDTSSGTPLNATITYGASGQWTTIGAGDGLNFATTATSLTGSLTGTKVNTGLSGAQKVTLEIVVDSALSMSTYDSYFQIVDGSSASIVSLTINHAAGGLLFSAGEGNSPNDCLIRYAIPTSGVLVIHVVVDSTQAIAANRVQLFVNGSQVTPTILDQLGLNVALDTGFNWSTATLSMGAVGAAPSGKTYYAALYAVAFSSSQVSSNASTLASNNDADPNAAGSIAGSTTFTLAPSGAPTGAGAIAGVITASLALAAVNGVQARVPYRRQQQRWSEEPTFIFMGMRSATIQSSVAGLAGSTTIALVPTGTSSGVGAVSGSTIATLMETGALTGKAGAAGATTIAIGPTATAAASGALIGSGTATIAPAGSAGGAGTLGGATTASVALGVTAFAAGVVAGSTAMSLAPSGAIVGAGQATAAAVATLSPTGLMRGDGALSGSATAALVISGVESPLGSPSGSVDFGVSAAGTLTGIGLLVGSESMSLIGAATVGAAVGLVGALPVGVSSAGAMNGAGALTGGVPGVLAVSASAKGAGALAGPLSTSVQALAIVGGIGATAGSVTTVLTPTGTMSRLNLVGGETDLAILLAGTITGVPYTARVPYGRIGNTRTFFRRE